MSNNKLYVLVVALVLSACSTPWYRTSQEMPGKLGDMKVVVEGRRGAFEVSTPDCGMHWNTVDLWWPNQGNLLQGEYMYFKDLSLSTPERQVFTARGASWKRTWVLIVEEEWAFASIERIAPNGGIVCYSFNSAPATYTLY